LQEALQNAIEHSRSKHCQGSLSTTSNEIQLIVSAFATGFEPEAPAAASGLGLAIMKERLNMVNGDLSIESLREGGTTICARVPLIPNVNSALKTDS
jgi:signal transduction histidine kinase